MTLITLFCILGATVVLGVLSVVFRHSTSPLNFSTHLLAYTSYLLLALFSANLSSSFGGYTIFISVGLAILIGVNLYKCVKTENLQKIDTLFIGIFNAITLLCFAVGGITLANLNLLGLLSGLFAGLGAGLLVLIFRKLNFTEGFMVAINTSLGGIMLGQAIVLLLSSLSIVGCILYFVSALLILFQLIFSVFVKEDKVMLIISRAAQMLSIISLALSIYFMV